MKKEIREFFKDNFSYRNGKLTWIWREDYNGFPIDKKLKLKVIRMFLNEDLK